MYISFGLFSWGQSPVRAHREDRNTTRSSGPASVFIEDTLNFKGLWSHRRCQLWNPGGSCVCVRGALTSKKLAWKHLLQKKIKRMQHVGGGWWFHFGNACVWSARSKEEKTKWHTPHPCFLQNCNNNKWYLYSLVQRVSSFSSIVKSLIPNALEYSEYFILICWSSAHELPHLTRLACHKRMLMCECSELRVVFRAASQCAGFVPKVSKYVFLCLVDGAHLCVLYLYPYRSSDCLTSSIRCLLINVALPVDVYECF